MRFTAQMMRLTLTLVDERLDNNGEDFVAGHSLTLAPGADALASMEPHRLKRLLAHAVMEAAATLIVDALWQPEGFA